MTAITRGCQRLMELAHKLRGFGIGWRLTAVEARRDAQNEGERLDIVFEVLEEKAPFAAFFQVEQMPPLEVAGQNVARALGFRQPVVIIQRLVARLSEVEASRLLLDDQRPRPEQVDEALLVPRQVADPLLVGGDLTATNTEAVKKLIVKGLCFALFVSGILVLLGEGGGTGADF